jgi:hypothetical protein
LYLFTLALGQDFELCIRAENVVLPKSGYFGVSAATGGLADDHDVLKFITHSLRSPDLSLGRPLFGKLAADRCSIFLGKVWDILNFSLTKLRCTMTFFLHIKNGKF